MNSSQLNEIFLYSTESFYFFLLINITTIFFSAIGIVFSLLFISTIIFHRSLRTVANILTLNSTVAIYLLSVSTLSIAIYVLYRDINQQRFKIQIEMKNLFLCHLRGYLAHVSFGALMYSYVIQAFYRLVMTIFYHRIYFKHLKLYIYAICIQWIFAFLQTLPIELGNNQVYIQDEYLCQIAIENSQGIGYINTTNYLMPSTIIIIMYYIIAKSVRQKVNGTYKYNIHRARRQLVLTQRILILIGIVLVLGGPYTVFILLEMFSIRRAPIYSHRVGFMFIAIAAGLSIIAIICFTQSINQIIFKCLNRKNKYFIRDDSQGVKKMDNIGLIPSTT